MQSGWWPKQLVDIFTIRPLRVNCIFGSNKKENKDREVRDMLVLDLTATGVSRYNLTASKLLLETLYTKKKKMCALKCCVISHWLIGEDRIVQTLPMTSASMKEHYESVYVTKIVKVNKGPLGS
jgi:hypothetical protein